MKGKILALVALASLVALSGCPTTATGTPAPTAAPTPAPVTNLMAIDAVPADVTDLVSPAVTLFNMNYRYSAQSNQIISFVGVTGGVSNYATNYEVAVAQAQTNGDSADFWYGGWGNGGMKASYSNDTTDGGMLVFEVTANLGWGEVQGGFAILQRPDTQLNKCISLSAAGVDRITFEFKSATVKPSVFKTSIQMNGSEAGGKVELWITNNTTLAAANPNADSSAASWTTVTIPVSIFAAKVGTPLALLIGNEAAVGDIMYIRNVQFLDASDAVVSKAALSFWTAW